MTPEQLIAQVQTLADPFLVDTCDVSRVSLTTDGFSGKTLGAPSAFISDLPCMVEQLGLLTGKGASQQIVAGGITYNASHRIFVKTSDDVLGITPRDQIKVHARGDSPQMIFEQLIVVKETFSPLISIYGTLVVQGFRTPGTI